MNWTGYGNPLQQTGESILCLSRWLLSQDTLLFYRVRRNGAIDEQAGLDYSNLVLSKSAFMFLPSACL
jgi:hypothetical protein